MKVEMGKSIEDVLQKALDPPTPTNIQRSIASLVEVGALIGGKLSRRLDVTYHGYP